MNLDIKFSDIEHLTIDDNSQSIIKNAILNGNITDICCLQLREHFFKSVNLFDYLKDQQLNNNHY
jgi:hypothetical protein